jgi:arginine/lysine/ornithine decarboxylase
MPLLQAMRQYADSGVVGFHTPGHKQGKGVHSSLRDLVTPLGWKMEVSLMDELDDLHEPTMCIKEAQDLAADLYGADATYLSSMGQRALFRLWCWPQCALVKKLLCRVTHIGRLLAELC